MGKRGMSPIIATILLIAFAVSLGAMIMNWSSSLVTAGAKESLCADAKIQVRSPICYEGNAIRINVANTGESRIEGLVVSINSEEFDQNLEIKNSAMDPRDVLSKSVPTLKPTGFTLRLLPKVMVDDETETCESAVHTTSELPTC